MTLVKGRSTIRTVVLTLDTSQYADGDVLVATQKIEGAVAVSGGTGVIETLVLQDDDDNAGILDLVFFDANTSIGTVNDAVTMADNDTILGSVEIVAADYVDMINSQHVTKENVGIGIRGLNTSIYMAAVYMDTNTYTAAGLTVRLFILLD